MTAQHNDNPLGLDGFEFIEFCAPERGVLEPVFAATGFARIARHRSKDVDLWRQGEINLIANYEPKSAATHFAAEHGPSVCGMGWRVRDAGRAHAKAIARGAEPVDVKTGGAAAPCFSRNWRFHHLFDRSLWG